MSKLQDKILAALVAELDARTEWGEVPGLYSIRLGEDREPVLSLIPVPDSAWDKSQHGMRTAEILYVVALRFAANAPMLHASMPEELDGVHGIAFRYEGWGILDIEPGTARTSEAFTAATTHTIAQSPDRQEIRMILAVDRAGGTYQVLHPREGARHASFVARSRGGQIEATGSFVESLDAIMSAVTGDPLPGRRPGW